MTNIFIQNTAKYGRGVFAYREIKKDELIESAPVIIIPKNDWALMRKSIFSNYVFRWGEDKALALGYGSLYNHSYTPNARYFTNIKNQSIDYYARENIFNGDEITINYNGDPNDLSPLWFEVIA